MQVSNLNVQEKVLKKHVEMSFLRLIVSMSTFWKGMCLFYFFQNN